MKGNFARCVLIVVDRIEKGYTVDNGGPTKYGVTIPFLASYWRLIGRSSTPTADDIRKLARSDAEDAYRRLCWDACACDALPAGVDLLVFDAAVNSGTVQAARWLQQLLGVKPDGQIGPVTLARLGQLDRWQVVEDAMQRRWRAMRTMSAWQAAAAGWGSRLLMIQSAAHKMIYTG